MAFLAELDGRRLWPPNTFNPLIGRPGKLCQGGFGCWAGQIKGDALTPCQAVTSVTDSTRYLIDRGETQPTPGSCGPPGRRKSTTLSPWPPESVIRSLLCRLLSSTEAQERGDRLSTGHKTTFQEFDMYCRDDAILNPEF